MAVQLFVSTFSFSLSEVFFISALTFFFEVFFFSVHPPDFLLQFFLGDIFSPFWSRYCLEAVCFGDFCEAVFQKRFDFRRLGMPPSSKVCSFSGLHFLAALRRSTLSTPFFF